MGKTEHIVRSAKGEGKSNDEVMTPSFLLDAIVRVLGPIGLDPCSHPRSIVPSTTAIMLPKYAPATAQFAQRTIYADGLQVVWRGHGLVFCNPPYSKELKLFLSKGASEFGGASDEGIVFLVPSRTGNRFWPTSAGKADVEVRLSRVKHLGEKTHAPFAQWLLYFGNRVEQAMGLGTLGDVRIHPRHTTLRTR